MIAENDLCGKQPPVVERTESNRIKGNENIVADGRNSDCRHIVLHTMIDPGEGGEADRRRCRVVNPAARGPGCAEHPGRDERKQKVGVAVVKTEKTKIIYP